MAYLDGRGRLKTYMIRENKDKTLDKNQDPIWRNNQKRGEGRVPSIPASKSGRTPTEKRVEGKRATKL